MKQGLAPIGRDGEPVQLHHEGQKNEGVRKEMLASEHRKVPVDKSKPSEIDREGFDKERREYWKERARDFDPSAGREKR
jgi:hypothetical protein